MKVRFLIAALLLINSFTSFSQNTEQPFINEVRYFKKLDSLNAPPERPILFIGSSSFTLWKDVKDYFPGYPILNRGFGGSSIPHLIMYAEDVIFRYNPKQIVIYCGENDLGGANVTGQTILNRFKELHSLIRSRYPKIPIAYISMKPSPSREKNLKTMKEGNKLIKKFIRKKKNTVFIDVFHHMLNKDGSIMTDIFKSDNLHMNAKGYAIWKPLIEPHLLKN